MAFDYGDCEITSVILRSAAIPMDKINGEVRSKRFKWRSESAVIPVNQIVCYLRYGGITPVLYLPVFYFTVGQALAHTPPNQGRDGAMGRRAFGLFSASRRSWRAILRQCTELCLVVDTSYQACHKTYLWIRLSYLKNFLVLRLQWILLVFAFWPLARRPVSMLHTF